MTAHEQDRLRRSNMLRHLKEGAIIIGQSALILTIGYLWFACMGSLAEGLAA